MTNHMRKPASQSLIGVKLLIIAISLSGTLFGWAVLAAGQVRDALLNRTIVTNDAVSAPLGTSNSSVTSPSITLPQTAPSVQQPSTTLPRVSGQFRPNARSRSSR